MTPSWHIRYWSLLSFLAVTYYCAQSITVDDVRRQIINWREGEKNFADLEKRWERDRAPPAFLSLGSESIWTGRTAIFLEFLPVRSTVRSGQPGHLSSSFFSSSLRAPLSDVVDGKKKCDNTIIPISDVFQYLISRCGENIREYHEYFTIYEFDKNWLIATVALMNDLFLNKKLTYTLLHNLSSWNSWCHIINIHSNNW